MTVSPIPQQSRVRALAALVHRPAHSDRSVLVQPRATLRPEKRKWKTRKRNEKRKRKSKSNRLTKERLKTVATEERRPSLIPIYSYSVPRQTEMGYTMAQHRSTLPSVSAVSAVRTLCAAMVHGEDLALRRPVWNFPLSTAGLPLWTRPPT